MYFCILSCTNVAYVNEMFGFHNRDESIHMAGTSYTNNKAFVYVRVCVCFMYMFCPNQ